MEPLFIRDRYYALNHEIWIKRNCLVMIAGFWIENARQTRIKRNSIGNFMPLSLQFVLFSYI